MSNEPENPPAFPTPDTYYPNGQIQHGQNGMPLRDYFAAQAMIGIVSNSDQNNPSPTAFAMAAYLIADAMLAARVKEYK